MPYYPALYADLGSEPGQGLGDFLEDLSTRFRQKRNEKLREFLASIFALRTPGSGAFRIIDLGGTFDYWQTLGLDFLEEHNIEITCINSTEDLLGFSVAHPRMTAKVGDARNLVQFPDNSFDLVHSNSVIEHVGRFEDMVRFAREVSRLAPAHYVQTPYFWFPIDPHFPRVPFFHYFPESVRLKLLATIKVGWSRPTRDVAKAMAVINDVVLLDRTQFRHLFPQSRHRFERFAFLPKSMIAERSHREADTDD